MTAPRFYVREGLARDLVGTTIELPASVAHHAVRVVRLDVGDALTLFDGTGGEYAGAITAIDKRGARARIDEFSLLERESPLAITLVQAIVASDAMDHAVRKSVELGVHRIAPVMAARSAPMPSGVRGERRLAHWSEIAVAACEQCGRNRVPAVTAPQPLASFAPSPDEELYVCVPDGTPIAALRPASSRCAVAIGPEGGFTVVELAQLEEHGARRIALGPRMLRTETAALVSLAILQALRGDLR